MEVVVLAKWVPTTQEEELKIIDEGRSVDLEEVPFRMNEWDTYAIEEAVRIVKEHGGVGWVISMGSEDADTALRRGIAMGLERGVLLETEEGLIDPFQRAFIFKNLLQKKGIKFDLLLTGGQAEDDEFASTGGVLAGLLEVPYASMVIGIEEISGGEITLLRELEGGLMERVKMALPAVVSIQTGINEPRYVSVTGVLSAAKKERDFLSAADFMEGAKGLLQLIRVEIPPPKEGAEIIGGDLDGKVSGILNILKEKGVYK